MNSTDPNMIAVNLLVPLSAIPTNCVILWLLPKAMKMLTSREGAVQKANARNT